MQRLTTSSYAVLGLLNLRSRSAYELTGVVRRTLAYNWPIAERAVYAQLRHLEAEGLAKSKEEYTGERKRTVYAATAKGRAALRRWLAEESAPPRLECEAMVRLTFGDSAAQADVLAAVHSVRDAGGVLARRADEVVRAWASGEGPYPGREHVVAVLAAFNVAYSELLESWAAWAESEIETWEGTGPGTAAERSREILQEVIARTPTSAWFRERARRP